MPTRPISPYGVTKLAAENLCRAYAEHDVPVKVVRYFSVYGPRQRPDMGYHRFIDAMLSDRSIAVFGDGMQARGNTYVDDCVAATVAVLERGLLGETYNVGGGETASVWDILRQLEQIIGKAARTEQQPARAGDQRSTFADTTKLTAHTGWQPKVGLAEGLARQVEWQRQQLRQMRAASA